MLQGGAIYACRSEKTRRFTILQMLCRARLKRLWQFLEAARGQNKLHAWSGTAWGASGDITKHLAPFSEGWNGTRNLITSPRNAETQQALPLDQMTRVPDPAWLLGPSYTLLRHMFLQECVLMPTLDRMRRHCRLVTFSVKTRACGARGGQGPWSIVATS